jgi:hypothetical protein
MSDELKYPLIQALAARLMSGADDARLKYTRELLHGPVQIRWSGADVHHPLCWFNCKWDHVDGKLALWVFVCIDLAMGGAWLVKRRADPRLEENQDAVVGCVENWQLQGA